MQTKFLLFNTRLVIWNNTLKFEYNKQTMLLQEKKETCKKNQNELNELKRKEAKVRRQYNEMLNQRAGSSSRASSAVNRESKATMEGTIGRAQSRQGGRVTSATRLADAQKEEEADKARVEQLKRQIEMNNAEILDNWDQIGIIKRNIFRVVQARQQNLDPAEMNQVLNSK